MALNTNYSDFENYLLWEVKRASHTKATWRGIFSIIETYFLDKEWTRSNIRSFCQSLVENGKKLSTVNNYIKFLRHIDALQKTTEMVGFKRFAEDKPTKEYLTSEECDQILACDQLTNRGHTELNTLQTILYRFLLVTGCRIMEALNLKHTDIHPDHVVFSHTKTHRDRRVYISPHMARQLISLPRYNEYVFSWSKGRLVQQVCHRELVRRAEICKIDKKIGCHTLRHTFVTLMGERDANILKVGAMTGQTANTIQNYYHSSLHHQKQVMILNPLESGSLTSKDVILRLKSVIAEFEKANVKIKIVESKKSYLIRVQK